MIHKHSAVDFQNCQQCMSPQKGVTFSMPWQSTVRFEYILYCLRSIPTRSSQGSIVLPFVVGQAFGATASMSSLYMTEALVCLLKIQIPLSASANFSVAACMFATAAYSCFTELRWFAGKWKVLIGVMSSYSLDKSEVTLISTRSLFFSSLLHASTQMVTASRAMESSNLRPE